jgi:hypothetical protein
MKFRDIKNRSVAVGDKVVLLVKKYGYCSIRDAYIVVCTYTGKGQYGYEFSNGTRFRNPIVYKIG